MQRLPSTNDSQFKRTKAQVIDEKAKHTSIFN